MLKAVKPLHSYQRFGLALVVFLLAALAFLPGLWGPFLLDTRPNLDEIKLWLEGKMLWQGVVFHNDSGPLGRPISMLSFLVNADLAGHNPFHYKLVNLLVHLVCAGLIFGFLKSLLKRDPLMGHKAALFALALALWWTLLPIQVSTVLYTIQRMAQLAALFMIAGLWLFVIARNRIENGDVRGYWMLWLGIPIFTALAALSKENGLLLPFLCLALELGYYRFGQSMSVKLFFVSTVAVPAVVGIIYLLIYPEYLIGGYINRPFTLIERALTEARVLWSYVRDILIPFGPSLGVYHDNYSISKGLLNPPTTAAAIVAWGSALVGAWWWRRAIPALLTGLLLYLFAHAMESTIFSLELVFLHRNYLAALGILLSVTGTTAYLYQRLPTPTQYFRRAIPALLIGFALVLWSATFARSLVWQSKLALITQELEQHPESMRARMNAAILALNANRPSAALHQIEQMEQFAPELHVPTVLTWKAFIYCAANTPAPNTLLQRIGSVHPARLHHYVLEPLSKLVELLEQDTCPKFNARDAAFAFRTWLPDLKQSSSNERVWKVRYYIGNMLAANGDLESALDIVMQAWRESGKRFDVGVLAFRLAASLERTDLARQIVKTMESELDSPDLRKRRYVRAFQRYVEDPQGYLRRSQRESESEGEK